MKNEGPVFSLSLPYLHRNPLSSTPSLSLGNIDIPQRNSAIRMPHLLAMEHAPLLDAHIQTSNGRTSNKGRIATFFAAEGQPSWLQSMRYLLLGSWLNMLLVFIPLSFVSQYLHLDAGLRFGCSIMAIVPLAKVLGEATEQLSLDCGQTIGGLLNVSFGNAIEIIVSTTALVHGQLRIVQTAMLGSILAKLLLVLGTAFFFGGLKYLESIFQQTAAQTSSSLTALACMTLVIPAAYHSAHDRKSPGATVPTFHGDSLAIYDDDDITQSGLLFISRGTAILLLIVYATYLYFQLVSHKWLFVEECESDGEEELQMSGVAAASSLLVVTLITSFCAGHLVSSIEDFADVYQVPKQFIGIILLPLAASATELIGAVRMAMKGKVELTIALSVGSSIQIASLIVPFLVIVGWAIGQDLTLYFADFETICLFASVMLVNLLIQDGKSNYMEGLLLVTLYCVIALAFWVS